jgi:signal transduction histidine kinase
MFELCDKPNSPITTEAWNSVFSASTAKLSLQLDVTKQARTKYRINHRTQARQLSTAEALPHPSAFVKQRHKFEGKVFYALLELIANSLDATRHNQGIREITVELHKETTPGRGPSSYCVSITDNGRGMDEAGLTVRALPSGRLGHSSH